MLWAGTGLAAAEDQDAVGSRPSPRKNGRRYLVVGTGLEGSKNFEKTEQLIVLFLSLEVHSVHWPHKVLYCDHFQDQLQMWMKSRKWCSLSQVRKVTETHLPSPERLLQENKGPCDNGAQFPPSLLIPEGNYDFFLSKAEVYRVAGSGGDVGPVCGWRKVPLSELSREDQLSGCWIPWARA